MNWFMLSRLMLATLITIITIIFVYKLIKYEGHGIDHEDKEVIIFMTLIFIFLVELFMIFAYTSPKK